MVVETPPIPSRATRGTSRTHRWAASPRALGAMGLGTLVAAVFAPVLFGGRQFFHSDAHALLYPLKEWMAERLRAGELPLWEPSSLGGYPALASYIGGTFLPQNLLLVLLPFPWAFGVLVALKHALAAGFQWLFLERLGVRGAAAIAGAALFACAGPLLSLSDFHAFAFECFPLLAWSWWRVVEGPDEGRWRRLLVAALAWTFAFFHGDLQTMWTGGLLALALPFAIAKKERGPLVGNAMRVTALCGLVALLGAVQLLPSATLWAESTRGAMPESERLLHSLAPSRTLGLFVPSPRAAATSDDFVAYLYLGAVATALAFVAVWRRRRDPAIRFFVVAFAAALVIALGANVPGVHDLLAWLPGFTAFRYPEKWLGLAAFALATLAAFGVAASTSRRRRLVAGLAVADVAIAALLFVHARTVDASVYADDVLPRLGELDLDWSPHDRLLRLPTNGAFPRSATPTSTEEAIAWNRRTLLGNAGSALGYRRVSGLSSFEYRHTTDLLAAAVAAGNLPRAMDLLAARWVLTTPADAPRWIDAGLARPPEANAGGDLVLLSRASALPRAALVPSSRAATSREHAIAIALSPDFDPRACVAVESCEPGSPAETTPPSSVPRFLVDDDEHIALDVTGVHGEDTWLVLSDSWMPGWNATIDGAPHPVLRANGWARAVRVPPGSRQVEWRYEPGELRSGALISTATLVLVLGALLVGRGRRIRE